MVIIKSQGGKRIIKTSEVSISTTPKSYGIEIPYRIMDDSGMSLGFYKSEERAKEVMGMIENHIEFLEHVKLFKTHQYFRGEVPNTMIFTMPKE